MSYTQNLENIGVTRCRPPVLGSRGGLPGTSFASHTRFGLPLDGAGVGCGQVVKEPVYPVDNVSYERLSDLMGAVNHKGRVRARIKVAT